MQRVRIREQTNMGGIVVPICYRPPDQEGELEEVFFRPLEEVLWSQAMVLMWNHNNLDICKRSAQKIQEVSGVHCW